MSGKVFLTTDAKERKETPITTGVLDYFPRAMAYMARISKAGNDQHNPGQPLHWAKEKSTDHADCIARHLIDRGKFDSDGMRHSGKLAWRACANLEIELEQEELAAQAEQSQNYTVHVQNCVQVPDPKSVIASEPCYRPAVYRGIGK